MILNDVAAELASILGGIALPAAITVTWVEWLYLGPADW